MKSSELKAKVKVISNSGDPFEDRVQAGQLLARALSELRGKKAVVLGIPRGGIVVAQELARILDADLDVVLSRKLGTPGQAELAMGALAEDGKVFLNEDVVRTLGITDQDIELEKSRQLSEIQRRNQLIRNTLPKTTLKGRIVIVTDDGLATGATMQAALWAVRQGQPQKLIAAVPVASMEALERVTTDADEVICLRQPASFFAVGEFYQ